MSVGQFGLAYLLFFVAAIWLVVRVYAVAGGLLALLTFLFWPAGVFALLRANGGERLGVAIPFVACAVLTVMIFRGMDDALADANTQLAALELEQEGALGAFVDEGDPIGGRVKLAQAMGSIAYQRGEIAITNARVTIDVPSRFRWAPRPGLEAMATQLGSELPKPLAGWLVHDSVDLEREDAWVIEVSWHPIGHVAESDAEDLADPDLAAKVAATTAQASDGGVRFDGFAYAPAWRPERNYLTWSEKLAFDAANVVDCYAAFPTRDGVVQFAVTGLEPTRSELCLRAVRLMAARTRSQQGHAYADYSFWRDARSGSELTDLVVGVGLL